MPRNASGVYTLPAGNPVVPGTTIDANWANSTLSDISNELTNSLSRTGAGGMLAPFRVDDGIVTGPGLAFVNETNTGYFRSGAGATAFSVLGVSTLQINTTSVTVPATRTLNAAGAALVGSTLGVTGAATFSSTLVVTGALTATGGVTGNITAASGTSTFNNVVINGSLDMVAGSAATITGLSTPVNASDAANKGYVDTQDALRLALTGGTLSGVLAMGSNKITGLGTPTNDADAATKAYVDSVAQGLDVKASVRAATTGNITLSGAQTIDGVAVIAGDRVLVKDQSTAANNGIYVAAAGAWSRSDDANTYDELVGAFTFVEDGTVNDNAGFVCTSPPGGTLGVTAITFEQFSGAGQVNAGTGMTKTGNTLNVNTASSARIVVGADEIDLAQTGVAVGTYKSVTVDLYGRVTAGTNPTTLAGYGISDAYTAAQTDSLLAGKLSLTGGTLSGALAMGTNRVTGMGDPINAQDAATKNYIDTVFGSTATAAASAAAAAASASAASTSASNASTSASNASTSASNASNSATAAAASAASAAASYDSFDDRYLGAKTSDPTLDNDGNPLITGALYFNSVAGEMRVWTGSAWASTLLTTGAQTFTGVKTFASNPIFNGGTANGVLFLNGSKVATSGSALVFDGSNLGLGVTPSAWGNQFKVLQSGASSHSSSITFQTNDTVCNIFANAYFDGGNYKYITSSQGASQYRVGHYTGVIGSGFAWSIAPSGTAGNNITFTQAMTLDASGNLVLGTTGAASARLYVRGSGTTSATASFEAANSSGNTRLFVQDDGTTRFFGSAGSETARITSDGNLLVGNTSASGRLTLNASVSADSRLVLQLSGTPYCYFGGYSGITGTGNADDVALFAWTGKQLMFGTNGTERARIDSSGNFLVAKITGDVATVGTIITNDGRVIATTNDADCMVCNRQNSDGTLMEFRHANTTEGSISVSGTTVSYNGGNLSRWAQMLTKPDLLKGTVMSNLDEMNVYTKDGEPVDNEQLNKVKISDVEGDVNVAGVFVNWSYDEAHQVDEINMAMTGDMIIRIAQGVVVQKGDLLMSAGDGTAKPQGDDIVRSKTVAKVTSNHVTCTYPDGSYCVPCVLMAC